MKARYASYTRTEARIAKAVTAVVSTVSKDIAKAVCAVILTKARRSPSRLKSEFLKQCSWMRKSLMQNLAKEVSGATRPDLPSSSQ